MILAQECVYCDKDAFDGVECNYCGAGACCESCQIQHEVVCIDNPENMEGEDDD